MATIQELQAKSQSGSMTPADIEELKVLSSVKPTLAAKEVAPTISKPAFEAAAAEVKASVPANLVTGTAITPQQKLAASMHDTGASNVGDLGDKVKPMTDMQKVAESMKGSGLDHVGDHPPMEPTAIAPVAPVAPVAKAAPVAPEARPAPVQVHTSDIAPVVKGEEPVVDTKQKFGATMKELAKKYGVGLLEVIEAVGKYKGGITTPTTLDRKYQAKLAADQQALVDKLETARTASSEASRAKEIAQQQAFTSNENVLNRIADKEAQGIALNAQEKLTKMTLAGRAGVAETPKGSSVVSFEE